MASSVTRPATLATCLVLAAACGAGSSVPASHGTGPATPEATTAAPATLVPATAAPTTPATTAAVATTASYVPSAPQRSPLGAADALLAAWLRGSRAAAGAVASPAAVSALFTSPARRLQARGCSNGQPPLTCSYADRSSATGHFFEIDVVMAGPGTWYVDSVQIF